EFHVHGITHADTDEEREFLRRHVSEFVDNGAVVYCEQGIRRMYFSDFDDVYEMDDYRWALGRCDEFGVEPEVESGSAEKGFGG
ncbi:MAG: hypothetical protein SV760_08670, partial [Halobacteria archaeon]|nr:hypothetical protein [Halobacteria archaeon]